MDLLTLEERKKDILNDIRVSRNNLIVYQMCYKHDKVWKETVALENEYFNSLLKDLVKIKKELNGKLQAKKSK